MGSGKLLSPTSGERNCCLQVLLPSDTVFTAPGYSQGSFLSFYMTWIISLVISKVLFSSPSVWVEQSNHPLRCFSFYHVWALY